MSDQPNCCPTEKEPQKSEAPLCCPTPEATADEPCCAPPAEPQACCAPASSDPCCSPGPADDRPGYKLWPFVSGWLEGPVHSIPQVSTRLSRSDILNRWQMRWGLGRMSNSIAPGLYAIGEPTADSPVLVSANYKMTFDFLRRDLRGHNVWVLALDTKGVNVWCAAGKGTFGTEELVKRIEATKLGQVVSHRKLILPQLGAPGIAAHQVKKSCGFSVSYGPVRSSDLPAFLGNDNHATEEMRQVTFNMLERLVLTPVELVSMWRQILWSILILFVLAGFGPGFFSLSALWSRGVAAVASGLTGVFVGAVLMPLLLPWLPGRSFALKGAILGALVALIGAMGFSEPLSWLNSIALMSGLPAIASWCAMNFTGSATFTSPSGVEKEMRQAIPGQAAALLVAGVCWFWAAF